MRIIIQRVKRASVTVDGQVVGAIDRGLCLLIGVHRYDTIEEATKLVNKVLSLRLWPDKPDRELQSDSRPWQQNVQEISRGILAVSQFTLYAKTMKGSKPDFHDAMKSEDASIFFNQVVELFRNALSDKEKVQTGAFGQLMSVDIVNDGPVTIILESEVQKPSSSPSITA